MNNAGYKMKYRAYMIGTLLIGVIVIPIYLFNRARVMKKQPYCFVIWIVLGVLSILVPIVLEAYETSENNNRIMTVKYNNEAAQMLLQYRMSEGNRFYFNALEINGVPQSIEMYNTLMMDMHANCTGQIDENEIADIEEYKQQPQVKNRDDLQEEKLLVEYAENTIILSGSQIELGVIKEMNVDIDEYGEIDPRYWVQISCVDLDRDDVKEVIVSIGDKLVEMETAIFTPLVYTPNGPFGLAGIMDGQTKMWISDQNTIVAPYGSVGLFCEYQYSQGIVTQLNP